MTKGGSIFDHINRGDIFRKDDSVGNSSIQEVDVQSSAVDDKIERARDRNLDRSS